MKSLQKMGGIAALYEAVAYIAGMVGFLAVVNVSEIADPGQKVAAVIANMAFLSVLHLVVYVVWAVFLVVLALALYERLKADSPAVMQTATVFAMIWACIIIASGMIYNVGMETVAGIYGRDPAQAATVWLAIESVFDGIGGGNEIVGGIWVLLVSWTALRTGAFPKGLNYVGVVIGAMGIISAVPGLGEIGMIFGLGQIVWFIWLGIAMLRGSKDVTA